MRRQENTPGRTIKPRESLPGKLLELEKKVLFPTAVALVLLASACGGKDVSNSETPSPVPPAGDASGRTPSETMESLRLIEIEKAAQKTYDTYAILTETKGVDPDRAVILTWGALFDLQQSSAPVVKIYEKLDKDIDGYAAAVLSVVRELTGYKDDDSFVLYKRALEKVNETNRAAQLTNLAMLEEGNLDYVLSLTKKVNKEVSDPHIADVIASAVLMHEDKDLNKTLKIYRQIKENTGDSNLAAQLTILTNLAGGDMQKVLEIYRAQRKLTPEGETATLTFASIINGYNTREVNTIFDRLKTKVGSTNAARLTLAATAKTAKYSGFAGRADRLAKIYTDNSFFFFWYPFF